MLNALCRRVPGAVLCDEARYRVTLNLIYFATAGASQRFQRACTADWTSHGRDRAVLGQHDT